MFRSYDKGYQMDFPNGLTVSVMFGRGNYCKNYNNENEPQMKCEDAEICVFKTSGQSDVFSVDLRHSAGHWSSTLVGKMIGEIANFSGENYQNLKQKLILIALVQ